MAHFLTGTATGPGAGTDFFNQLINHMVANGWTKQVIVNSTCILMKGVPLDATADAAPYVYVNLNSTTTLQLIVRFDWNTDPAGDHTNVGTAAQTLTIQDASFPFWVRCNGHAVAIMTKISTTYYKAYAGHLRRGVSAVKAGISKTTAALAVGATTVPLASDMTGKLQVGQKVMIKNNAHNMTSANKSNAELVTISAITGGASPSLTVSATTLAYDAGALVGRNPDPNFVTTTSNLLNSNSGQAIMTLTGGGGTTYAAMVPMADNVRGSFSYLETFDPAMYSLGWWSVVSQGSPYGYLGTMYHCQSVTTDGSLSVEDILDDGEGNQYLVTQSNSANNVAMAMGPMD